MSAETNFDPWLLDERDLARVAWLKKPLACATLFSILWSSAVPAALADEVFDHIATEAAAGLVESGEDADDAEESDDAEEGAQDQEQETTDAEELDDPEDDAAEEQAQEEDAEEAEDSEDAEEGAQDQEQDTTDAEELDDPEDDATEEQAQAEDADDADDAEEGAQNQEQDEEEESTEPEEQVQEDENAEEESTDAAERDEGIDDENAEAEDVDDEEKSSSSESSESSESSPEIIVDLITSADSAHPANTHPRFRVAKHAQIRSAAELEERLQVEIRDSADQVVPVAFTVQDERDAYAVTVTPPAQFVPGQAYVRATLDALHGATRRVQSFFRKADTDADAVLVLLERNFAWGTVLFNADRDVYQPGATANFTVLSLDAAGQPQCDAAVTIAVTAPDGSTSTLSAEALSAPACTGADDTGFRGEVILEHVGVYELHMTVQSEQATQELTRTLTVSDDVLIDVARTALTAGAAGSEQVMLLQVTPSATFVGTVAERVPPGATVTGTEPAAEITLPAEADADRLQWHRRWEAGETYELRYTFTAPETAPLLSLFGPVEVEGHISEILQEAAASSSASEESASSGASSSATSSAEEGEGEEEEADAEESTDEVQAADQAEDQASSAGADETASALAASSSVSSLAAEESASAASSASIDTADASASFASSQSSESSLSSIAPSEAEESASSEASQSAESSDSHASSEEASVLRWLSSLFSPPAIAQQVMERDFTFTEGRQWEWLALDPAALGWGSSSSSSESSASSDAPVAGELMLEPTDGEAHFAVDQPATFRLLEYTFESEAFDETGELREESALEAILDAVVEKEQLADDVLEIVVEEEASDVAAALTDDSVAVSALSTVVESARTDVMERAVRTVIQEADTVQAEIAQQLETDEDVQTVVEDIAGDVRDEVVATIVEKAASQGGISQHKAQAVLRDEVADLLADNTVQAELVETAVVEAATEEATVTDTIVEAIADAADQPTALEAVHGAAPDQAERSAPIVSVRLRSTAGFVVVPDFHFEHGSVVLAIEPERRFRPGLYTLEVAVRNPLTGEEELFTQDFAWGVLAMNPDKDRYLPGDVGYISMAVLDDHGEMVCDADVELTVVEPDGNWLTLSTADRSIHVSPTCVVKEGGLIAPDYSAYVRFVQEGTYTLKLKATTANGTQEMTSAVRVDPAAPVIIKRTAATRLWPEEPSPMTIEVTFRESFAGSIVDVVPAGFEIRDSNTRDSGFRVSASEDGDGTVLTWPNVRAAPGDTITFSYSYDAPDVSPEFYLIGPLQLNSSNSESRISNLESRAWQIANDAPTAFILRPDGDSSTQMRKDCVTTGNYSCVDETSSDGDTTRLTAEYDDAGCPGQQSKTDLFTLEDTSGQSGTISGVTLYAVVQGELFGMPAGEVRLVLGSGSDRSWSSTGTLVGVDSSVAYETVSALFTQNPFTMTTWTMSDLDSLNVGVEAIMQENSCPGPATGDLINVSQLYVEVDYEAPTLNSATLRPNAAGDESNLTVNGCTSNYECVDEVSHDGDTTYVYQTSSCTTQSGSDLYQLSNLPDGVGDIDSIVINARMRVDDPFFFGATGSLFFRHKASGGSTYTTIAHQVVSDYMRLTTRYSTNPDTGVAWTASEIDGLQAGAALEFNDACAATGGTYLTQLYVDVIYASGGLTHTVTGRAYEADMTTPLANKTIKYVASGTVIETAETDAGGMFTVNGTNMSGGDVITLFLDGETENGATVVLSSGGTMTGINLYRDYLIVRSESGSAAITNTHLAEADNGDTDLDDVYTSTGGTLTLSGSTNLYIWDGTSYEPGGGITARELTVNQNSSFTANGSPIDVNGPLTVLGTFDQATSTLSVSGAVRIASGATFTPASNGALVTFDGDMTYENEVGGRIGHLQIGASPDTTTLSGHLIVDSLVIGSGDALVTAGYNVNVGTGNLTLHGLLDASNSGARVSTITVSGTWLATGTGDFISGTSTVIFDGSGAQTITASGAFYNVIVHGGNGTWTTTGSTTVIDGSLTVQSGALVGDTSLDINGSFTQSGGTFTAPLAITLSGSWTRSSGTFSHSNGSLTLDGGSGQTLSGSTTFFNLTKGVSSAQTLYLASEETQSVSGTLTLRGAASNLLAMRPTSSGQHAKITLAGPSIDQDLELVNPQFMDAGSGVTLDCVQCTDSGSNINWNFNASHTIGATVYQADQVTPISSVTVTYLLNGSAIESADTDAQGNVTLSGAIMTGGSIVTLFLDNETENGVVVTASSGSNMTGIALYQNHLLIRNDSSSVSAITNSMLSAGDSGDSDIDAIYSVTAGALALADTITLQISSGDTYQPGGTVAATDFNIFGTFPMEANNVTASGAWNAAGGSFSGTNTVTFANSAGSRLITSNGSSFNNLVVNGATWTANDALDVDGTFTVLSGTFSQGSSTLNIAGDTRLAAGAAFTKASNDAALTFDGDLIYEDEAGVNIGDVTIGVSADTVTLSGSLSADAIVIGTGNVLDTDGSDVAVGTGDLTLHGLLDATDAGSNVSSITVSGSWLASGTGDFIAGGSTVLFDGTSGAHTITASGAFSSLSINGAGATWTATNALSILSGFTVAAGSFTAQDTLDLDGDFTQTGGGFTAPQNITLSGTWLRTGGTFTTGTGTVTLDGGNQTLSGTTVFYNLTKTVSASQTLTIASGGLQTVTGALKLQGVTGNLLRIRSDSTGVQAQLAHDTNAASGHSLQYLDVQDSDASPGQALVCTNCVNRGNNTNWFFVTPTISGTAYQSNGSTPLTSATVAYSIEGGPVIDVATTDGSGQFTLSGSNMSGSDVITIFLDNETQNGVLVLLGSGGSMAGLSLVQNQLIARSEVAATDITTTHLDTANNSGDTDIAAIYDVSGGALTMSASSVFVISAGDTYVPGAAVTAEGLTVASGATFTAGGTVDVNGAFTVVGTFTQGTHALSVSGATRIASGSTFNKATNGALVTLDGDATYEDEVGASIGHVQIGASPDTTTLSGDLIVDSLTIGTGDILVTGGHNVRVGTGDLTLYGLINASDSGSDISAFMLSGSWLASGTGDFIPGTSTVQFDGTSDTHTIAASGAFYNLAFLGNGGTWNADTSLTVSNDMIVGSGSFTGTGTIGIAGDFTQTGGTFRAPDTLSLSGDWLRYSGTFHNNSGTVILDGGNQTMTGSTTFAHFSKTVTSTATLTLAAGTTQTMTGSLTLHGASSNLLSLRSSVNGTQANMHPLIPSSVTGTYLDVQDNNNLNNVFINPSNSTDSGNTTNWFEILPAPTILTPATGTSTGTTTPRLTGTGTHVGNTINIYSGSTLVGNGTVQAGSGWGFNLNTLAEGIYTLNARESNGLESGSSSTITITVDTTDPAAPTILSPASGSIIQPGEIAFTGTGTEVSSTITISSGATVVGTGTVTSTGSWVVTGSLLTNGTYVIAAIETDLALNTSASSAITVIINDYAPPTISTPATGTATGTSTPYITGTGSVSGNLIRLYSGATVVGSGTLNASSGWSLTTTALNDGLHRLHATEESSGLESAPSTAIELTIDTTAPATPTILSPSSGAVVGDTTPAITGTGSEAGNTITISSGATVLGTGTVTATGSWVVTSSTLVYGQYVLTATETDSVGNTSSGDQITVIIDPILSTLTVSVKNIGTSDTAVRNETDISLLRFEALADPNEDILLTEARFEAQSGSLTSLQNYTLWVDTNADSTVDTILQTGVSATGGLITFTSLSGGGYAIESGTTVRFEVHADVASSLAGDDVQLRFATGTTDYIAAEEVSDADALFGIQTNGSCGELNCDLIVTTTDSIVFNLYDQGDLFVVEDSTPVRSRQLLGGSSGITVLRLQFSAQNEDIEITDLQFTSSGSNASAVTELQLWLSGGTGAVATATVAGCASDDVLTTNPANGETVQTFCSNTETNQLVVPKGQDLDVLVQPFMKLDTASGLSDQTIQFFLDSTPAFNHSSGTGAVRARGNTSSRDLTANDEDDKDNEGEVFIGTSSAAANARIVGTRHKSVLAKIDSITDVNPDDDGTAVPSGVADIAEFQISAATHGNSLNGFNDVTLSGVIFTITSTDIHMSSTGFTIYNNSTPATSTGCTTLTTGGAPLAGSALSGNYLVQCRNLEASSVVTEVDQGTDETFVLSATVTENDFSSKAQSTLQVSLTSFTDIDANDFAYNDSHFQWLDEDTASGVTFNWVDSASSTITSTLYGEQAPAPTILTPTTGTSTGTSTPRITGTGTRLNNTIRVLSGTTLLGTDTVPSGSGWSIDTSSLADGTYTIHAVERQGGIDSAASNTIVVTIDTTAPDTPTITAPTSGTTFNVTTVVFSGTGSQSGNTITLSSGATVIGTGTLTSSGTWTITGANLLDGTYIFSARETDTVGNISGTASVLVTVNTVASVVVTGTAYSDQGITPLSGATVAIGRNGAPRQDIAITDSTGTFSLSGSTMSGGDVITIYLDDGAEDGVTVVIASGSQMTGIDVYQDTLIVRSETGSTAVTPTHLDTADDNGDTDITPALYTLVGGTLQLANGTTFLIWANDQYTSTGAIITAGLTVGTGSTFLGNNVAIDVNGPLTIHGTFNQSGSALTASGDVLISASGAFTKSQSGETVTFDGDLSFRDDAGVDLGALNIGASPDTTTLTSALNASSLTIGTGDVLVASGQNINVSGSVLIYGTLDATDHGAQTSTITLSGSWTTSSTGSFTIGSSTVNFDGDGQTQIISGSGSFYGLTVSGSGNTVYSQVPLHTDDHFTLLSGTFAQSGVTLTIGGDIRFASGSTFTKATSGTFILDGTQTIEDEVGLSFGTVSVAGSGFTATQSGTVRMDTLSITTGSTLATAGHDTAIGTGSITIDGTLDASNAGGRLSTITLSGAWIIPGSGSFVPGNSRVVFDSTTGSVNIDNSSAFYNVSFAGSGGTWTATGTLAILEDVDFIAGTLISPPILQVGGDWHNGTGTFLHNSGSVIFNGSIQAFSGSTTFFHFQKYGVAADRLVFEGGSEQTVLSHLELTGTRSSIMSLRSSTASAAKLTLASGGTQTLERLNVQLNDAGSGETLICASCIDAGNNINWLFLASVGGPGPSSSGGGGGGGGGGETQRIDGPHSCLAFGRSVMAPFVDIEEHWAEHQISTLQRATVTLGYDSIPLIRGFLQERDGRQQRFFYPDEPISRQELVELALLANCFELLEHPDRMKSSFRDVPKSLRGVSSAEKLTRRAIYTALHAGFIEPYPDRTFRGEEVVSRAEALRVITLAAGIRPLRGQPTQLFADVPVTEWYAPYVERAVHDGWISGLADDLFQPDTAITRAEVIKALYVVVTGKRDERDEDAIREVFGVQELPDWQPSTPCLVSDVPLRPPFSDVHDHWSFLIMEDLQRVRVQPGLAPLIQGYLDGERRFFAPNQAVTRFELLKLALLGNCIDLIPDPHASRITFSDVAKVSQPADLPDAELRRRVVYTAAHLQIVRGYEDGTFRPDAPVTRAEAVKILLLAARVPPAISDTERIFADVPLTRWYAPYIQQASALGVISGYDDGAFRPEQTITRAEAAKVLTGMMEPLDALPSVAPPPPPPPEPEPYIPPGVAVDPESPVFEYSNTRDSESDAVDTAELYDPIIEDTLFDELGPVNDCLTLNERLMPPFSDAEGHWSERYVRYLEHLRVEPYLEPYTQGFFSVRDGRQTREFRPDQAVTRFELLKFALQANCVPLVGEGDAFEHEFIDVPLIPFQREYPDETFKRMVIYTAAKYNIVKGYEDGTLRPDEPVTRAEALKILILSANLPPLTGPPVQLFSDVPLWAWFAPYVERALFDNLISGEVEEFYPERLITRGEVAKMVYELVR